jgi:LDH2 family malate/lactate/ureidoglycolate dehydrogenase
MRKPDNTGTEIKDANLVSLASTNTGHLMSPTRAEEAMIAFTRWCDALPREKRAYYGIYRAAAADGESAAMPHLRPEVSL